MNDNNYKLRNENGQIVFEAYTGAEECFHMPGDVSAVADNAFANNKSLKHVDLGNVTRVGAFAFQDCSNLETVVMKSVEVIGHGAFEFCRSLKSVTIGNIKSVGEMAFRHCRQLDIPDIPRSLTSLGTGAFSHTAIHAAHLDHIGEIPKALFSGCASLTYADVSGAKVIGEGAFEECKSLSTVILGAVEIIEKRAFYKCDSFEARELPGSLHTIGDETFEKTRDGLIVPKSVRRFGRDCLGSSFSKKVISVYGSSLYYLRDYFAEEAADPFDEDEHFYMWESSIDITILDDATGKQTGYLPLFTDLDRPLKAKLIDAFRPDGSFDYRFIDTVLFEETRWNIRCKDSVAIKRLKYPYELSEDARKKYSDYLKSHSMRILKSAIRDNDPDVLAFMLEYDLAAQEKIREILEYSISLGSYDCTAILLERSSEIERYADPLLEEL